MAERMPLNLFREWSAYARLVGGIGQARHDWNAAMVATTIANVVMATHAKNYRKLRIRDVMYGGGQSERAATITDPRDIYRAIRRAAIAGMGARDPKAAA